MEVFVALLFVWAGSFASLLIWIHAWKNRRHSAIIQNMEDDVNEEQGNRFLGEFPCGELMSLDELRERCSGVEITPVFYNSEGGFYERD